MELASPALAAGLQRELQSGLRFTKLTDSVGCGTKRQRTHIHLYFSVGADEIQDTAIGLPAHPLFERQCIQLHLERMAVD